MSNGHTIVHQGHVTLAVLLSRDFMGGDHYRSRFSLPVDSHAYSTERKQVRTGQGHLLKQFLENPVRTSPNPENPAKRTLPGWIYRSIERYMVRAGRTHRGYALELVGIGEPSITWRLQRLVARRAMRYNPVELLGAQGEREKYKQAMNALKSNAPLAFRSEAEKLAIERWIRQIHFVLRMSAFNTDNEMNVWIDQHPRAEGLIEAIDRQETVPLLSDPAAGEPGREWFKTMGWYALPHSLVDLMDDEAKLFAFSRPEGMRLLRAYFNRGPDNPFVNFLNWPLEAAALAYGKCPPGTVVTEFTCDLRLEIYSIL